MVNESKNAALRALSIDDNADVPAAWNTLPINQSFYVGKEFKYRAARTPEVRDWSTIIAEDYLSVFDHSTSVLASCVQCKGGHWKDMYEIHRMQAVLMIREATFPTAHNVAHVNCVCADNTCKNTWRAELDATSLSYVAPQDTDFGKYWSDAEGCFVVKHKIFGEMRSYVPTIGSLIAVKTWVRTKQAKMPTFIQDNLRIIDMMPSLIADWRNADAASLEALLDEYYQADSAKLAAVDKIYIATAVNVNERVNSKCPKCFTETSSAVQLGGLRDWFLVTEESDFC